MTPEEFRKAGHQLIDWIADYRQRIPELPVKARVRPGEVRTALPGQPPEGLDQFSALLAEYTKAPEVTRRRIYIETMQDVLPGIRSKVIIDERTRSILPLLNLDAMKETKR